MTGRVSNFLQTTETQAPLAPRASSQYRAKHRVFNRLVAVLGITLALAAAPAARAAEPIILAVLGDSLTAGFGLAPDRAFPARLEAALRAAGEDVRVINAGVSGDTSAGGLARLDWVLGDEPDAVIVELGSNDSLRGLDPADTYANLEKIVLALKARDMTVMLAGMMAPRNLGREYVEEFDAIYPRLAAAHDILLYPFFLDGVALNPALNQADMIHPNEQGVDAIVSRMLPSVRALLARVAR